MTLLGITDEAKILKQIESSKGVRDCKGNAARLVKLVERCHDDPKRFRSLFGLPVTID